MSKDFIEFVDGVVEYHQFRGEIGLTAREATMHPDTLEVFADISDVVADTPELSVLYAAVLNKRGTKTRDQAFDTIRTIETQIVDEMHDAEILSDTKYLGERDKLRDNQEVRKRADRFIKLFRAVIPDETLATVDLPSRVSTHKHKRPRQSRTIDLEVTADVQIVVNGKLLSDLTPIQNLIILSGLAKADGFRYVEIYDSPEFMQVAGDDATARDTRKDRFDRELEGLTTYLESNGLSRLFDNNRKPASKKHTITASSIVDQRITKQVSQPEEPQPPVIQTRPVAVSEERKTWGQAPVKSEQKPHMVVVEKTQRMEHVYTVINGALNKNSRISRIDLLNTVASELNLDEQSAKELIARVYAYERASDNRRFRQIRTSTGGRVFVPYLHTHEAEATSQETAMPKLFGQYFEGGEDEFRAKHGETKGVTPTFVNYERGAIYFTGSEAAIIKFFANNLISRAVSQKMVSAELGITNDELKEAVKVINALVGKIFIDLLDPASRATSSKGPRIQQRGAFMEDSHSVS